MIKSVGNGKNTIADKLKYATDVVVAPKHTVIHIQQSCLPILLTHWLSPTLVYRLGSTEEQNYKLVNRWKKFGVHKKKQSVYSSADNF